MGNYFVQLLIIVLLILMNAFFAGSEIAFISLNQVKMRSMAEDGNRRARLVLKLTEMPTNFLSTIQIGVSLASMLSGAFAADTFADLLAGWIVQISNGAVSIGAFRPFAVILITLVNMFLMLVLGELVPKRIAMANSEGFAFFIVYPVYFLSRFFKPLVKLLSLSTNVILRLIGIDPHKTEEEVTEEEIRIMVEAGEINLSEKEMIRNVFEFDNHEVGDIMTHRTDMIAIDVETDFVSLMELVDQERFTRYPVYEDNVDNIIGIFHLRDLIRFIREGKREEEFDLRANLREPYFVPDSKHTDALFAELKHHKTHIAVVIDEYGGTAGIITMEDLIEEVMGNIMDEYDDEEENPIVVVQPDEYIVEGYTDLEDLNEILDTELPIDDYDTVSGFMIGELGRIPTQDDAANPESDVEFGHYRFSILEVEEKVISKIRIIKKVHQGDELSEETEN